MKPYLDDGQVTLYLGDLRDVLPELPEASVDAIVCDPPYEYNFMGRSWDASGVAYDPEAWRACWRVLKPGGHLIAFGAPRTYHRMTCAIEDAGFEIRDSIHWVYGSGMPKGQNIGKAIDRHRNDRAQILQVTGWLNAECKAAGWTRARLDSLFGFNGMSGHWTAITSKAAAVPTPEQWDVLRDALGFDDTEIRPLVAELNGRKGALGEAWIQREVIGEGHRVRRESDVQFAPLSAGAYPLTAPNSDAARQWHGWNTQLSPAHEPIVLARKSTGHNTTVANVLEHGTGALNIDACRTAGIEHRTMARTSALGLLNDDAWEPKATIYESHSAGRWPTNLLLTHRPLVDTDGQVIGDACEHACVAGCSVAELDQQTGVLKSGANPTRRSSDKFRDAYGDFKGQEECTPARGADSGGASRFFPVFRYEAKAPASERPRLPDGTAHTTVKPLSLVRFLVRLVTPPGGTVLDPFAGSGTTGEAAAIEGFRAVLVEKEEPHAELIKVRLSKPLQATLDIA